MTGRNRVRALNGLQRPMSSLSGTVVYTGRTEHLSKRQRTDAQTEHRSTQYSKFKKRLAEDIVDGEDMSKPDSDLAYDGSQQDSLSVTSGGNTAAITSALPAFRGLQHHLGHPGKTNRPRKSRAKKEQRLLDGSDEIHVTESSLVRHPSSDIRNSPDHLSTDPLSGDDPPPANIRSDITTTPKRAASGPHSGENRPKRQKKLSGGDPVSEDELTTDVRATAEKRPTNFLRIAQPEKNSRQRGDIPRTDFKPTRPVAKGNMVNAGTSPVPDLVLIEAAGGKYAFSSVDEPSQQLKLHLGETSARVLDDSAKQFAWLEIQRSTVQSLQHGGTKSPLVQIKRSQLNESPASLALRFAEKSEPLHLLHWLGGIGSRNEASHEQLELIFANAYKRAHNYVPVRNDASPSHSSPAAPRSNTRKLRDPFKAEPINTEPRKLKDRMKGGPELSEPSQAENTQALGKELKSPIAATRSEGVETRRTRRLSPKSRIRETTPDRWSLLNSDWHKDWHRSLIYPAVGKNRATVDRDDIPRLDEGEFLNDNLISFYMRYLQVQLEAERPEILRKVYFFSTFFFEKLRANRTKINYEGVQSWTAKVDLLSYDYIMVPVNENAHWYLAIIYNAPNMISQSARQAPPKKPETIVLNDACPASSPKVSSVGRTLASVSLDDEGSEPGASGQAASVVDIGVGNKSSTSTAVAQKAEPPAIDAKRKSVGGVQRFSMEEPRIVTLDSLGSGHSPTCRCLREYLIEEAKHKRNLEIVNPPGGMTARGIPHQDNFCDCGVFLLGYMEHFLKDPDEAMRKLLQKEDTGWDVRPSRIRTQVRDLLFKLQGEQQERVEEEKRQKRQRKAAREAAALASEPFPSSPQVPLNSSQTVPASEGMASPLTNGANKRDEGQVQRTPKISPYFQSRSSPTQPKSPYRALHSSPGKPGRPHSSSVDGKSKAAIPSIPLKDDSSQEVKVSTPRKGPNSAQSSSTKAQLRAAVDLAVNKASPSYSKTRFDTCSSPKFVKKLSSSPGEVHSVPRLAKRTGSSGSANAEVTFLKSRSPTKSPRKPEVIDLESPVLNSIENDSVTTNGAQYDGVDRSID